MAGYIRRLAKPYSIDSVMAGRFDADAQPSAVLPQTVPATQKRLKELSQWADKHGEPGTARGTYRIKRFAAGEKDIPDDADMLTTTREQYHRDHVYGPEMWDKLKDSLLSPGLSGSFMSQPNAQRVKDFSKPLHVFTGNGIDILAGGGGYASPQAGFIAMNPTMAKNFHGYQPGGLFRHEIGHVMNDPADMYETELANPARKFTTDSLNGRVRWGSGRHVPQEHALTALANADSISKHLNYTNTLPEFMAEYSRLKGFNYGLTGEVPMTPKQHIEMLKNTLREPVDADLSKGLGPIAPTTGPEPTMQYGPQKGRKADGYHQLQFYLQGILQDLDEWDMEILGQLGPHIVSNEGAKHAGTT